MRSEPCRPRVLVAPDKFKGTLTGMQAAEAIAAGVLDVVPGADVRTAVVADGGEGTVDAAIAAGGQRRTVTARGPLGAPVVASWARLGNHAVVELAASSGLQLIAPTTQSALDAHTEGLGDVLRAALDDGARSLLVGLGGSASTDAGVGALRALGARFLDEHGLVVDGGGGSLARIARVDLEGLDPRLASTEVTVMSDVEAPLLGPRGAAAVYGPQKGADGAVVATLETGLRNVALRLREATGRDMAAMTWSGAAGGTAGGLHAALGAAFVRGIDRIAELTGLDDLVRWADVVIAAEGSFDVQTLQGKGPMGVIRRARRAEKLVVVVAGRVELSDDEISGLDVEGWGSASLEAPHPSESLGPDAATWVRLASATALRSAICRSGWRGDLPRA